MVATTTINKTPPLPPLPAKSKKEINIISKYFQAKNPSGNTSSKSTPKSYAQASKNSVNTSDVLKIKETFPSLNTSKIDQVNSIVNGQDKPKPRIRMTTKGPSRKQIIILMSSDNISSFMKNTSSNVANLNRELRNAKTDVLVNYIRSDNTGVIIVTNKVAQQSDLSIIDRYVKNSNNINTLQVEDSRLPKSKSFLKITGIPFYPYANSQEKLSSSDVETILKQNHIFLLHPNQGSSKSRQNPIWLLFGLMFGMYRAGKMLNSSLTGASMWATISLRLEEQI